MLFLLLECADQYKQHDKNLPDVDYQKLIIICHSDF